MFKTEDPVPPTDPGLKLRPPEDLNPTKATPCPKFQGDIFKLISPESLGLLGVHSAYVKGG